MTPSELIENIDFHLQQRIEGHEHRPLTTSVLVELRNSMASTLSPWTREAPTEPGLFLWEPTPNSRETLMRVEMNCGHGGLQVLGVPLETYRGGRWLRIRRPE